MGCEICFPMDCECANELRQDRDELRDENEKLKAKCKDLTDKLFHAHNKNTELKQQIREQKVD